jgi:hypothetical protein
MAEAYNEPDFTDAAFTAEERRRMRRMLWYYDRSDFLWATIRRWALIWTLTAVAVLWLKDSIKWILKEVSL